MSRTRLHRAGSRATRLVQESGWFRLLSAIPVRGIGPGRLLAGSELLPSGKAQPVADRQGMSDHHAIRAEKAGRGLGEGPTLLAPKSVAAAEIDRASVGHALSQARQRGMSDGLERVLRGSPE